MDLPSKRLEDELNYLASPYSHPDPFVREWRYLQAAKLLSQLLEQRRWTYSPIVHCHELKKICSLPAEHTFWLAYDCFILKRCSRLLVLRLPAWEDSRGVRMEMEFARANSIPIEFADL